MKYANIALRIGAYILDLIIVGTITSLLILGMPRSKKYYDAEDSNDKLLKESIEEQTDVDLVLDKYFENKYIMEKESVPINLVRLAVTFGYFVIFAAFNKGQTIGKKLLHIKVVSYDGEEVNYYQLFGRSLIINSCLLTILNIIFINIIKPNQFIYTIGLFGLLQHIIIICSIIMASYRKDRRSLHDIIFKTKVIEC